MAEAAEKTEVEAPTPQKAELPKRPAKAPLVRSRLSRAEHMRLIHVATAETGTTHDDLHRPEYWKMVSPVLSMGDRIEVYCEDGSFFAEFLVRACGINFAAVHCLRWHDLDEVSAVIPSAEFEVKYGNMHTHYRVIRKSDNEVIRDGFRTKDEAEMFMKDHIRALAR